MRLITAVPWLQGITARFVAWACGPSLCIPQGALNLGPILRPAEAMPANRAQRKSPGQCRGF
jgi:hypothetical protein